MPHPPSWLCLMLLLSSICNFSNGLDGTNYSRKTLMQCRPRSNSAAGHSDCINHAAPTRHGCGKELPLLSAGPDCSPVLSSVTPPCLGTARRRGGLLQTQEGAWRCLGRSQVLAEHPWEQGGGCQQRGRASPSVPLSCPAGVCCYPGVTAGCPGDIATCRA